MASPAASTDASASTPTSTRPARTARNRGEIRVAGERLLTVAEAANSLGLCIDSVRRHLRSGKLEGVRVGGAWRVPESKLMAQLGLLSAMVVPGATIETTEMEGERARRGTPLALRVESPNLQNTPLGTLENMDLVATLLRTPEVRGRVLAIVEAAAVAAEIKAPGRARLAREIEDSLDDLKNGVSVG